MAKCTLYTDGGSRGNPGPAGIGAVIYDEQRNVLSTVSKYIGETTNNQAEYQALYAGLSECQKFNATQVDCFLDSELLVKQMKKEYKVKDAGLSQWFVKVWNLLQIFEKVTFTHIPREKNTVADSLVNQALDAQEK